jgi:hypothetical protein
MPEVADGEIHPQVELLSRSAAVLINEEGKRVELLRDVAEMHAFSLALRRTYTVTIHWCGHVLRRGGS